MAASGTIPASHVAAAQAPVPAVRLAVVSDAVFPWHKGGKEMRYFELLSSLDPERVDATVFTMAWWDGPAPQGHRALCPRVEMYAGERRSIAQALRFSFACLRLLPVPVDAIEADHMPYLQLFPLRVVATLKGVPLIVTWHELWGGAYWREYLGRAGVLAALLERAATRLPTVIVSVSAPTSSRLLATGVSPGRVRTLAAGVDMRAMVDVRQVADVPDLLFVGRLIEHKRVQDAISALALLRSEGMGVTLGVVGVGPEAAHLHAFASSQGVADAVRFYGEVESMSQVYSLMASTRVFLSPSVREGFGLAVAEALALGTPCVVTDHPANEARTLISHATGSAVPSSPRALADAVRSWLGRDVDRIQVRDAFLAEHPQASWAQLADAYTDEVLTQVARSRARRPSRARCAVRALSRAFAGPVRKAGHCSCRCHGHGVAP